MPFILIFLGVFYLIIRVVSEDLHECIFVSLQQNYDQVNVGYMLYQHLLPIEELHMYGEMYAELFSSLFELMIRDSL